MRIPGWFREEEGQFYRQLVAGIVNGRVLEIGNYQGLSLSYIFETCRRNRTQIYALDIAPQPALRENLQRWGNAHTVVLVTGDSRDADRFPDACFDLVFIDADHSYAGCRHDILAYTPKVKPGGLLAGHDYQPDWPGVVRAVDELCPDAGHFHSIWYTRVRR